MKKKRLIIIIQLLLFFSGSLIISKPLYRIGSLKYKKFRIEKIKQKWKMFDQDTLSFVYWLDVPAINISYPVLSVSNEDNLYKYPCLHSIRSQTEKDSLKLITAHRDMHFYNLKMLDGTESIFLEKRNGEKTEYKILEIENLPTEIAERKILEKKEEDWLVLMTCYPFHFIGSAPERFIVWAKDFRKDSPSDYQSKNNKIIFNL